MSIPINVQFRFGSSVGAASVNPDAVFTAELKERVTQLLTGEFDIDENGRCILEPGPWDPGVEVRDSVCVGLDLGPVEVSYCKDI